MVTVHREGGFRIAIYRNDHEPAHVHVIKDGEVIVNLVGADGQPEVRNVFGATKADVRKIAAHRSPAAGQFAERMAGTSGWN